MSRPRQVVIHLLAIGWMLCHLRIPNLLWHAQGIYRAFVGI